MLQPHRPAGGHCNFAGLVFQPIFGDRVIFADFHLRYDHRYYYCSEIKSPGNKIVAVSPNMLSFRIIVGALSEPTFCCIDDVNRSKVYYISKKFTFFC